MAGAPLTIRPFQPADQPALRHLVLAGLAERWGHLDASRNPDLDVIPASYTARGDTVLVAECGGQVIGNGALVCTSPGVGQIVRMSVDARARRQGIARALVAALLEAARRRGFQRVIVETTQNWHSVSALYQQCGFVQYDRHEDDVYLELCLTSSRPCSGAPTSAQSPAGQPETTDSRRLKTRFPFNSPHTDI